VLDFVGATPTPVVAPPEMALEEVSRDGAVIDVSIGCLCAPRRARICLRRERGSQARRCRRCRSGFFFRQAQRFLRLHGKNRFRAVSSFCEAVFFVDNARAFCGRRGASRSQDARPRRSHFVFVGRADTTRFGANFLFAPRALSAARSSSHGMEKSVGAMLRCRRPFTSTPAFASVNFGDEGCRIDYDPVPMTACCWGAGCRRDELQDEGDLCR